MDSLVLEGGTRVFKNKDPILKLRDVCMDMSKISRMTLITYQIYIYIYIYIMEKIYIIYVYSIRNLHQYCKHWWFLQCKERRFRSD